MGRLGQVCRVRLLLSCIRQYDESDGSDVSLWVCLTDIWVRGGKWSSIPRQLVAPERSGHNSRVEHTIKGVMAYRQACVI